MCAMLSLDHGGSLPIPSDNFLYREYTPSLRRRRMQTPAAPDLFYLR